MDSIRKLILVVFSLSLTVLWGCASIGPHTVVRDRFDYTGAIGDSWKQQMLLNVVKARYGDTPIFLDVASVISQYSLETGVDVNGQVVKKEGFGDQFIGMGAHGTFTDRPTITYTPLSGEKFARSLMKPLPPASIVSMIQAGYPIDFVLRLCVDAVNGISNRYGGFVRAHSADPEFYPLLERLRRIQDSHAIGLRVQKTNEMEGVMMSFKGNIAPAVQEDILFVQKTLGLDSVSREIRVVYGSIAKDDKELALLTRSILQIIIDLASYIEVPSVHVEDKIVNATMPGETAQGVPVPPLDPPHRSSFCFKE